MQVAGTGVEVIVACAVCSVLGMKLFVFPIGGQNNVLRLRQRLLGAKLAVEGEVVVKTICG